MKIRIYPDDILLRPCDAVEEVTPAIANFITEMIKFSGGLDNCIGLAANQVGRSLRVFIMRLPKEANFKVFINPEIVARKDIARSVEGCLSEPGEIYSVRRSKTVKVRYLDIYGVEHMDSFSKLASYIIQHEIDHLHGVLLQTKKKARKLDMTNLKRK